jgi:O-Antigen ligase
VVYISVALLGLLILPLVWVRPQRGVLLVAALVPLHGLLDIAPEAMRFPAWKEGLILLTLAAAAFAPSRGREPRPALRWWWFAVALAVFGTVSALATLGTSGIFAIKVTFFYMITLPLILYLCPFTARDRENLVTIMMSLGVFCAIVGIAQQVVGAGALSRLGYTYGQNLQLTNGMLRSFSTFQNPFQYAFFLMIVLLVGSSVALANTKNMRNQLFLLASPLLLIGIGVSLVRSAIIGVVVGLVLLAVCRFRSIFRVLIPAGVVAVGAAIVLVSTKFGDSLLSGTSLSERGRGWKFVFGMAYDKPFGSGLGATGAAAERLMVESYGPRVRALKLTVGDSFIWGRPYQPDNYYIKVLLELGPIGLWLLVALLIAVFLATLRAARQLPDPDGAFAFGVTATVLASVVAAVTSTYFEIFPEDFYFWLLVASVGCAATQGTAMGGVSTPRSSLKRLLDDSACVDSPANVC